MSLVITNILAVKRWESEASYRQGQLVESQGEVFVCERGGTSSARPTLWERQRWRKIDENVPAIECWTAGERYKAGDLAAWRAKLFIRLEDGVARPDFDTEEASLWEEKCTDGVVVSAWEANHNYRSSDLVEHLGAVYQCASARVSGEKWDDVESSNWNRCSLRGLAHSNIGVGQSLGGGAQKKRIIILCAGSFTALWTLIAIAYFFLARDAFLTMWPNEVGDLLAGWFAPLAMGWLVVAVLLQRDQLEAQQGELKQNTRALQMQAAELKASVRQLEKHTLHMEQEGINRERAQRKEEFRREDAKLGYAIVDCTQAFSEHVFQSPTSADDTKPASRVVGKQSEYLELVRRGEYGGCAERFGDGVGGALRLMEGGWLIGGDWETITESMRRLRSVERMANQVAISAARVGAEPDGVEIVDLGSLEKLRSQTAALADALEDSIEQLRGLD